MQIFPRQINAVTRLLAVGSVLGAVLILWLSLLFTRSSYGTNSGISREQPVPFSHQHHVGVLEIDCRYCHTAVESSPYAGMPPTKTCMNCHSQIWVGSEMLAAVRGSYAEGKPLHWRRIYNLPDFVYFDHSIHVQKGIGCSSCHGEVDKMPFTYQTPSLLMEWCLDCHRHPEREIRPTKEVFNIDYQRPADQGSLGLQLCQQYRVKSPEAITSCSVCHR
ncbi:MAG TPA: cytochrome c3 family protein [Pirellulales bacterium]|nr:cytochrome c3 family protein [Pirellulales bacterium]